MQETSNSGGRGLTVGTPEIRQKWMQGLGTKACCVWLNRQGGQKALLTGKLGFRAHQVAIVNSVRTVWFAALHGERGHDLQHWYLSFGSVERGFFGAAIVFARGPATAAQRLQDLGINPPDPECEMVAVEIPRSISIPPEAVDRLLMQTDVELLLGKASRLALEDLDPYAEVLAAS